VVLLMLGTGCPHDWMREGTNDRAMRKDVDESLDVPECPPGKTWTRDCTRRNPDGTCLESCQ
jgi:hypothetical protein